MIHACASVGTERTATRVTIYAQGGELQNKATQRCMRGNEVRNGKTSRLKRVSSPATSVGLEAKSAPAKTMGHPTAELRE